jgi:signal transduction histidine kinase
MTLDHTSTVALFFIYGLAFFAMGLAVALEARRSRTRLAFSLRFLAAFGILHGLAQWVVMLLLVQSEGATVEGSVGMRVLALVLSSLSALFLLQFGVTLLESTSIQSKWPRLLPVGLMGIWVTSFAIPHVRGLYASISETRLPATEQCIGCHWDAAASYVVASKDWLTAAGVWSRYLLFLPGCVVAAAGLASQAPGFRAINMPRIARQTLWAAGAFLVTAVVAGMVVAPAPYPPASVLNYATFTTRTAIPPQVLWAVSATAVSFFVVRILNVFELERNRQMRRATAERLQAQEEALRVRSEAHRQAQRWSQRLEKMVDERTAELEAFYKITSDVSALPALDEVLSTVTERARALLGADVAALLLRDEAEEMLVTHAVSGDRSEGLAALRFGCAADGPEGILADGDDSLPLGRRAARRLAPELHTAMTQDGLRTLLAAPLTARGQRQGLLLVGTRSRRGLPTEAGRTLSRLASATALVLENARLYMESQRLAVLEERDRIAREMHDSLAQVLGLLGLKTGLAGELLAQGDLKGAESQIRSIEEAAESGYREVRASILELRSGAFAQQGLLQGLVDYAAKFSADTGIQADVEVSDGASGHLSATAEIQLIRIIQEALANVRKHAGARQALVTLGVDDGHVLASVQDDGCGFDPRDAVGENGSHFGLQTMRERAESIGGVLEVDTALGTGTTVVVRIPANGRGGTSHANSEGDSG